MWFSVEVAVCGECLELSCNDDVDIPDLGDVVEFVCEFFVGGDKLMFKREDIFDEASETVFFILLTRSFSVVDVTTGDECSEDDKSFMLLSLVVRLFEVSLGVFSFLAAFTISIGFSEKQMAQGFIKNRSKTYLSTP